MTEENVVSPSNGQESNEKENGTEEEQTDLEKAIIRQVEYYFGK